MIMTQRKKSDFFILLHRFPNKAPKTMMIKKIIIFIFLLLNCSLVIAQEKQSGYFDNGNIEDTLEYKFVSDSINGPSYECDIICNNDKEYNFYFGVGFEGISFFNCGKGCIEASQTKDGMMGFDVSEIYRYKKDYDNWILEKTTITYVGGKKEIYKPKIPTGIDGTEYKTNKVITLKKKN
jgi:hypothetical protein